MQGLSPQAFSNILTGVAEGDVIEVHYNNQNIDDQRRNPLSEKIRVTGVGTPTYELTGERVDNPARNRDYAINVRTYGGEKKVLFVRRNHVRGMRDTKVRGEVVDVKSLGGGGGAFDFS